MMDNLLTDTQNLKFEESTINIGILPGTKSEVYENLIYILSICLKIEHPTPLKLYISITESFSMDILKNKLPKDWKLSQYTLETNSKTISLVLSTEFLKLLIIQIK